jgi:hypothetical protein
MQLGKKKWRKKQNSRNLKQLLQKMKKKIRLHQVNRRKRVQLTQKSKS